MTGIYKITSPTGKVYIGQSINIILRKKYYAGAAMKPKQPKLFNSIKKHGWNNHLFEVVHELPPDVEKQVLDVYESLYMQQFKDCGIELMNVRDAGSRGRHSIESREKMIIVQKEVCKTRNQIPWNKGLVGAYKLSKESIRKRTESRTGYTHSEETKKKMRELALARGISTETREKMYLSKVAKGLIKNIKQC